MDTFYFFYKDILSKKRFFLPVLIFVLVAYSFSILNRTVSIGDLSKNIYFGSGNHMLSGRWGMVLWDKIVGTSLFLDPFVDRFLALVFLVMAAILFCFVFYSVRKDRDVLPYTIAASFFSTYPLVNEFWEYTGVDYMVGGNLCLATMTSVLMRMKFPFLKRAVYGSVLLLLPVSSYESAIFYYITLECIISFCELSACGNSALTLSRITRKNIVNFLPLVLAIILRFIISFAINTVYNLDYQGGGATDILWLEDSFFHTLKCMFGFVAVKYFLTGLVYFPITIFLFSILLFFVYIVRNRKQGNNLIIMGSIVVLSLFIQSIMQGYAQPYRTSQTLIIFVSFFFYLSSISIKPNWRKYLYTILFGMCWYQSVYLNRVLSLNNLRSDNELEVIRQIGSRLVSEYDEKPVAFIGHYQIGEWITAQITVDETTWNGRLFYHIYDKYVAKLERPFKYIETNVNSFSSEYGLIPALFSYCGYHIDLLPIEETDWLDDKKKLALYQIYDNGDYLVVNLGEEY